MLVLVTSYFIERKKNRFLLEEDHARGRFKKLNESSVVFVELTKSLRIHQFIMFVLPEFYFLRVAFLVLTSKTDIYLSISPSHPRKLEFDFECPLMLPLVEDNFFPIKVCNNHLACSTLNDSF